MKLYQGDCLEVMHKIKSASVDLILCDLPYGTTSCPWDSLIPLEELWAHYTRLIKPTGAIVLTANNPFSSALVMSAPKLFKYSWVWVKNRPTLPQHSKNRPMGKHEEVLVFSPAPMGHVSQLGERRMTYNPQGVTMGAMKTIKEKGMNRTLTGARPNQVGKVYQTMTGFPHTVLTFDKEETHVHPTQKPVALMEYMIRTYTVPGAIVLDNCMGSGTTGVACVNTGRDFIGIEQDSKYFEIARNRIREAHGFG